MKKFFFCGIIASCTLLSCSSSEDLENQEVTITLNFKDEPLINADVLGTRMTYKDESTKTEQVSMKRYYKSDAFGILPKSGDSQIKFVSPPTEASTVSLTSGAWNTKVGSQYACYYPYSLTNQDGTAIPFSYTGQVQKGNKNTDHLSDYVLIASDVVSSTTGSFLFTLGNMGTVIKFILELPNAGTFTKMTLTAAESNKIFMKSGSLNLFDSAQTFTAISSSNVYSIGLENCTLSSGGASEPLVVYTMFGGALKSKSIPLTVTVYDNAGNKYTASKTFGADLVRGNAYYTKISGFTKSTDNSLGTLTGVIE